MTDEMMFEIPPSRLRELNAKQADLIAERDAAIAAIVRLREALGWYAEPEVWRPCEHGAACCPPLVELDKGERARAALALPKGAGE